MRKVPSVAIFLAGLILSGAGLAEEPLGRLFFSPAQRRVLDTGKYLVTPTPAVPAPRSVHLSGVVTRSDAENTVWINGKAYHDASPDGVQLKTDRSAPASTAIRVPGKTATRRVKVGQRLDLNSGRIREDFSHRPAAAEDSAAPMQDPAAPPVAEKKSKATENTAAGTGDKGEDPATTAR